MRSFLFSLVFFFVTAFSFAADNVKLVAPTDPVEPGKLVQIMVTGLTEEQLNVAIVDWEPQAGVLVIPAKTWGGQPMILFQPPTKDYAKSYALWICWPYVQGGNEVCQGYVKARVQVGDSNPFPPPPPPPSPKPANPHPVPSSEWLKILQPLEKAVQNSKLPFQQAKQAGERLESLAAQLTAGALADNAQLFQAISLAGQSHDLGKEIATALGTIMEVQNPHTEKLNPEQAAWTLKYLAWSLWENSVYEAK